MSYRCASAAASLVLSISFIRSATLSIFFCASLAAPVDAISAGDGCAEGDAASLAAGEGIPDGCGEGLGADRWVRGEWRDAATALAAARAASRAAVDASAATAAASAAFFAAWRAFCSASFAACAATSLPSGVTSAAGVGLGVGDGVTVGVGVGGAGGRGRETKPQAPAPDDAAANNITIRAARFARPAALRRCRNKLKRSIGRRREADAAYSSFADPRFYLQCAAVQFNRPQRQRQPQSAPTLFSRKVKI